MKRYASILLTLICLTNGINVSAKDSIHHYVCFSPQRYGALSQEAIGREIQQRIARIALSNDLSEFNKRGMNAVVEKITIVLGGSSKKLSLLLEITSDGSISALSIRQTSGSEDIDKKGLDLVKSAAPFIKGENTSNKKYLVELPELSVKPFGGLNH